MQRLQYMQDHAADPAVWWCRQQVSGLAGRSAAECIGLPRYDLAVGIHAAVSCGTGHCGSWYVTAFDGSNAVVGARTFAVCSALTGEGMAPALKSAIDQLIQQHKVVVFMKGTKQFPQCGFSNTVVQVGFKQVIH